MNEMNVQRPVLGAASMPADFRYMDVFTQKRPRHLAIALSIYSSVADKAIPDDMVCFGEIGLGGEVRNVSNVDLRLREIRRLGFRKVIMPNRRKKGIDPDSYNLEIYGVSNIRQAILLI